MAEVTTPVPAAPEMTIGKVWFSFAGRISRSTWWMKYFLPILGISIGLNILDMVLGTMWVVAPADPYTGMREQSAGILSMIFGLVSIWIGFAAGAKRLHDRDKSGWWQLLWFVPVIGWIWMFVVLGFLSGTPGSNRFAPNSVTG
jgi:uncharacterized membrane protein YhaH (DUF805 family)